MVGRDDVVNASVSLFSSAGIGDLGIEYGCEIPVVLSAELNEKRADLISNNYPEGIVIRGDIVKTKAIIITHIYGLPVDLDKILKIAKKKILRS